MNRREVLTATLAGLAGMGSNAWWNLLRADAGAVRNVRPMGPLDELQLGHLRHIHNLAGMPDGEWRHMGSWDPGQEALDSYRYQLAFMAYSLGLTAYHYLPAAPRTLQATFDQLIQKMLRREVWDYWKETSRSGPAVDPGLTELRDGWTDPVVKENIMYSGHLLAMVAMYRMLFGDSKYDAEGALTFRYEPIFYGMGPEVFEYNHASLNDVIYRQFADHDWLGVPCEPNLIFVVCNQYPIFGFRFYDAVHGTQRAEQVISAHDEAWESVAGFADGDGKVSTIFMERQRHLVQQPTPLAAWTLASLNAWKPELVRSLQKQHAALWLEPEAGGRVTVRASNQIMALANGQAQPEQPSDWRSPDFGYVALWLSEMGDQQNLDALLAHADELMQPTWEQGGLFYPRNDSSYNGSGELTYMDPLTGNALLGYARLNPADGMRTMFRQPWKPGQSSRVQIISAEGAELRRAVYTDSANEIEFDMAFADETPDPEVKLVIAGLESGQPWSINAGSKEVVSSRLPAGPATYEKTAEGVQIRLAGVQAGPLRLIY